MEKDAGIVGVVNYHNPVAIRLVAKPVANKTQYISFWFIPARDLYSFGNYPVTFFKSGCTTCVDPKNPDFR
jgi:hypothetical protein